GRPFLRFRCRGTLIYFCLRRPTQGVTFTVARRLIPSRRARAAMLLGGVLANGLFGLLAWGLWWLLPAGNTLCLILASLNTITAVGNLIPFSIHRGKIILRSDGASILQALRGSPGEAIESLRVIRGLRTHLEAVGDSLILHTFLL